MSDNDQPATMISRSSRRRALLVSLRHVAPSVGLYLGMIIMLCMMHSVVEPMRIAARTDLAARHLSMNDFLAAQLTLGLSFLIAVAAAVTIPLAVCACIVVKDLYQKEMVKEAGTTSGEIGA